jgi:hypothetical protein
MALLDSYQTNVGVLQDGEGFFRKVGGYDINTNGDKQKLSAAAVAVTSAQLLELNATPQTILAAPGAGFAIVPRVVEFFLDYNSAAYAGIAGGEDLVLRYTDGSGNAVATVEATGFLDQTSDQRRLLVVDNTFTPTANAALVLHMSTGEVTTGNSPLNVRVVEYDIVKLMS